MGVYRFPSCCADPAFFHPDICACIVQRHNAPAASYSGRTALQAAAEGGHLDVVERLLVAKADVNAPAADDSGRTALQAAAGGGHLDIVKVLEIHRAK